MKVFGFFNSYKEFGDAVAIAVDETGQVLASHVCSNELFAASDLGMDGISGRKHDKYDAAWPKGWECEFVRMRGDRNNHLGLQAALKAHDLRSNAIVSGLPPTKG